MDRSAVKAIVDRERPLLVALLGIHHWSIVVRYEPSRAGGEWMSRGVCERKVEYNAATITLNPEAIDDEDQVLKTLRHELFHIVLAPFDLYRTMLDALIEGDPAKERMFAVAERHAVEKAVINLERMYFGLTHEAAKAPEPTPESA